MALTIVIERDGVVTANGDRYVTLLDGTGRTGLLCKVAVKGNEAWCVVCGRVQPDNQCGPCEDADCAGTNIGRSENDPDPDDGLTPEDIASAERLLDRLDQRLRYDCGEG